MRKACMRLTAVSVNVLVSVSVPGGDAPYNLSFSRSRSLFSCSSISDLQHSRNWNNGQHNWYWVSETDLSQSAILNVMLDKSNAQLSTMFM